MVFVRILKVQLVRVILWGNTASPKCLTSCSWLLGTSKLVLSKAYLLNLLGTSIVCKSFFLRAGSSSSSILDISFCLGCSHWVLERDACSLHVNFLLDHLVRFFIYTFVKIVPELIFLGLCYSLFDWFQFCLLVLRSNQICISLSDELILLQIWLKSAWHLVSAYHLVRFFRSRCPTTAIVLRHWYLTWFVGWLISTMRTSICLRTWVEHCNIICLKRINRLLWFVYYRLVFLSHSSIGSASDWIQHCVKLTWVHVFDLLMIFHLLNHLIHTWLLKVTLPEFKNPLISLLNSLLSQMHCSFSWIMALKRISEEV